MDINLVREIVTVASFATFAGIVAWAVSPRNGKRFEEAARLPLLEDAPSPSPEPSPKGEGPNDGRVFAKRDMVP